jgi:hypothetical protein
MQMALDDEEACVHWVRRADPRLSDNIVEDKLAHERYLRNWKSDLHQLPIFADVLSRGGKGNAGRKAQVPREFALVPLRLKAPNGCCALRSDPGFGSNSTSTSF